MAFALSASRMAIRCSLCCFLRCCFFFHSKQNGWDSGGSYLEADLEVVAELRAAAQLAVETLVDEAVELIRTVATVIVAVAQQRLVQAIAIVAHEGRLVARPLWIQKKQAALKSELHGLFEDP